MKVVCFKVDEALKEIMEREAKARGMSVSQLIRGAVWAYITSHPSRKGNEPRVEVVRVNVK